MQNETSLTKTERSQVLGYKRYYLESNLMQFFPVINSNMYFEGDHLMAVLDGVLGRESLEMHEINMKSSSQCCPISSPPASLHCLKNNAILFTLTSDSSQRIHPSPILYVCHVPSATVIYSLF